ncbi:ATP-dependent DNA ligase [Nocardioides bruguierae]|uniref:ATP-dependent DNA ligase n=1 Tax=Nocardioides bruguierae TaxID=2945102 RepID=UPI002021F6FC|nr:ATP-dependent DNA ligase [Nocardioides bruguierae]MCL8024383.1 ATP-dependent DNA ligase [Nocardioides bruguierae]
MLLHEVVATSAQVAATRSRLAKRDAVADLLGRTPSSEVEVVASWLGGSLRQRRTGVGWRSLQELPAAADEATLEVAEVEAALEALAAVSGTGAVARRADLLEDLFSRASRAEQDWLRAVMTGQVRQGALDAVLVEGAAVAAQVPVAAVRRAAMMSGSPVTAVVVALRDGEEGLAAVGLEVMRPVLPMLASSAPDVSAAVARTDGEVAVDVKLDGIRVQVHRSGDDVRVVTRTLDDITARLPEVVAVVRALPVARVVLDGEALLLGPDGRPRPFQETSSRTARQDSPDLAVTPWFFDVLHVDGEDLHERPLRDRLEVLTALVPADHRVARLVTSDPQAAEAFALEAVAAGHEGVVIKSLESTYEAGRRGASWVKVKPVHTLDLVVVAVEHGSGRRRGWLSNIHLAARAGDASDDLVMVGKTFKGMTDEMLAWQTERFHSLETSDDGWVVTVRPEQVVEVALDGVQRSTRYPGGVALRFARVVRYRDDKTAGEADTIGTVRGLLRGDASS